MSQISELKDKVLKNKNTATNLTNILELVREFGCLSDIIGSNFEVLDAHGNLKYTIKKKPMAIKQLYVLLKVLHILNKLVIESESAMMGNKGLRRR